MPPENHRDDAGDARGAYTPNSRRPIASIFRRTAAAAVRCCVRLGIHPDTVSYGSIVAAALAAACFWHASRYPGLLLAAPLFCHLRLWLNMLDGMVALASGRASPRGEIVNELPDRVSDVLIFVGVAHSGLCLPLGGYWAAILALLTAYVGVLGQAVGARRGFGGVMSKPWRMVTLHAGAWATLAAVWARGEPRFFRGATWLDAANLAVVLGCLQTVAVRLRGTLRELAVRAHRG